MSKTESWKTWAAVIVVLVAFGLFAAIWPSLSSGLSFAGFGGGPSTRLPNESHPIVVELPPTIQVPGLEIADMVSFPGPTIVVSLPVIDIPGALTVGEQTIVFVQPIVAVILLAVVVIGLVVVTGAGLGGVYTLLSRWVTRTEAAETYQEHKRSLSQKEQEKLKELRAGRTAAPLREDISMPRWSWISNTLIVLTFVLFGGMTILATFLPERVLEIGEELFNPALIIVGIPLLITLTLFVFKPHWGTAVLALIIMSFIALATFGAVNLIATMANRDMTLSTAVSLVGLGQIIILVMLAYRRSPATGASKDKVAHPDKGEQEKGIPYDAIAVLIMGLLIVGLGIGLMVLINSSLWENMSQLLGL